MSKRFMLIFLVFVAIFVGLFMFNSRDAGAPQDEAVEPTSHKVGEGTEGVTLIEYGDFQCPACAQYYPLIKQIKEKYGDRITFQFRHFPLVQIHPNAMAAHRAAEAAGQQDKFFEMHDMLYERQTEWQGSPQPTSVFERYAQELDIDMERFKSDVSSPATNRIVNADIKEAQSAGANSTPTFVLNDKKVEEAPRDLEGFSKLIDEAIEKAKTQE
ncbi:hypothetical protein BH23PAT1_BH23PAT1_4590 [soil metagenome]